jgi:ketosteroid isomerase-like protein
LFVHGRFFGRPEARHLFGSGSAGLRLFAAIDRQDVDAFTARPSEDVRFRFGNAAGTRGRAAVHEAVVAFFRSVSALRHELSNSWHCADHTLGRGRVTCTRHDGSMLSVPFANVFRMHDGKIREYDIYVDISQVYA